VDIEPVPGLKVDFYLLGYDRDPARFNEGFGGESRYSWGTRLWGKYESWDYNLEGLYQWGDYTNGNINAWTFASDTGYSFLDLPGRPRLGLKANSASGDETQGDGDLNTFNALYPKGGYFGEIGILGPSNFFNLHPNITWSPVKGLRLYADTMFFWRESLNDGVYGPSGNLLRAAGNSRERYVGTQVDFSIAYQVDPHWNIALEYGHFFTGNFLRQTGPSEDVDFVQVRTTYRF
jgi:hypothetical protein